MDGIAPELIADLFARVLPQHAAVDAHDDFLDLGGDSILAVALMAEILKATGRTLPITAIYDAPTPAAMAALLAAGAARPRGSCLVPFRQGSGLPLFLVHGLGGAAMELRDLALRLQTDGAVYGVEARGLDGAAQPFDRVEDMAECYLADIRRAQPAGPYRLAGFSFGGLVALEMAQRLMRAGETVSFLCLLDTHPHTRVWPLRSRIAAWARVSRFWLSPAMWRWLATHYAGVLAALPARERWGFVAARARRAATIPFDIFRATDRADTFLKGDAEALLPDRPELRRVHDAGAAR